MDEHSQKMPIEQLSKRMDDFAEGLRQNTRLTEENGKLARQVLGAMDVYQAEHKEKHASIERHMTRVNATLWGERNDGMAYKFLEFEIFRKNTELKLRELDEEEEKQEPTKLARLSMLANWALTLASVVSAWAAIWLAWSNAAAIAAAAARHAR